MDSNIIGVMIGISTFLGALGLVALLWGLRTGQFDDQKRFLEGAQHDNEEDLQDAVLMDQRREEAKKKREKNYRPAD